jgi:hypothetical protein
MKWLPVILTLCGLNPFQTFQIIYVIKAIWTTGAIFLGRCHH